MLAGRPWIEAGPLLAAAGFATGPIRLPHPIIRSLQMADLPDYAFRPGDNEAAKPVVCNDLAGLARVIERRRDDRALELVDVEDLELPGRRGLYDAVQIYALLPDGSRDACLGWAWLNGQGRDRLEPALRAARRTVARREAETHARAA